MTEALAELSTRIREEIEKLAGVVAHVEEGCRRADRFGGDYYLEAVALSIHGILYGDRAFVPANRRHHREFGAERQGVASSTPRTDEPRSFRRSALRDIDDDSAGARRAAFFSTRRPKHIRVRFGLRPGSPSGAEVARRVFWCPRGSDSLRRFPRDTTEKTRHDVRVARTR